jgi:Tol biopolymer transport system component
LRPIRITLLLVIALVAPNLGIAHAAAGGTVLVSRGNGEFGPVADTPAQEPSISADGRYVAFHSAAGDLVPDDDKSVGDVFVRDVALGETILVSRASGANGAGSDGPSSSPSISADGRYVAFNSDGNNLSTEDLDTSNPNIFVRDLQTDATILVSRASGVAGLPADGPSFAASISADGSRVAFHSFATNLTGGADLPGVVDVFVRDLRSNITMLVSTSDMDVPGNFTSAHPTISADGKLVTFHSSATTLVADENETVQNVFVRNLAANTTTLVSRASTPTGAAANDNSEFPAISADGRFVSFTSKATNLDPTDTSIDASTFVRELSSATTSLVSRASGTAGPSANDASWSISAISADGRFVAFASDATNLSPDDTDPSLDVFVRDREDATTTLVSRASGSSGAKGNNISLAPSISADGRFTSFESGATNLHPDATNGGIQIFLRDVLGPQPPIALSIGDVAAKEGKSGTTPFTFTVTLDGVPGRTVTVDYATKNGSATVADNDYERTNGTLTFLPGETSKQIVVTVNGDNKREKAETFRLRLFNASGAEIEDGAALGLIRPDDRKGR